MRGRPRIAAIGAAALVAVVLGAAAGSARAEVVWLCKPGLDPNPCRDSLETTVYEQNGSSRVENPPLPADPPIDCFYVYPTVSEQRNRNADKSKDPEIVAIAQHQASRYSQTCRVYAPVYRQQTLGGLALGGSAEALQLAYGDVVEAWEEYLRDHNGGRGFVLVGHSQGTRMLRQLLRKEIDPRADVRGRLVSAILLGGNVTVRKGQRRGGDFQNVAACDADRATGCVIAWSTFNEDPPSNSRYGREPTEDTSGFGFPSGPEYEVLCTNPASLGANERRPLTTYLRGQPFPGVIGGLLVVMYGGPQPSAPTAFLQPPDRYTGRCERRSDANVLMIEPIGSSRRLTPSPDPSWGLHLADGNIALGDLVDATARQSAAYLSVRGRPRLELRATYARGRYGARRRCARPPLTVALAGADVGALTRATFAVGSKPFASDSRAPFGTRIGSSALRPRSVARLVAEGTLADGRTRRLVRHVRICP
jgi:hypothetical protein